jgi:hypothetical protein
MTTRRLTKTMARVSATTPTPTCQDTVTMRRASRQVRKCPTTCHSLIKTRHGTRWMTLIMTQTRTRTQRKLPIPWMCEARRRTGLFELLFWTSTSNSTLHTSLVYYQSLAPIAVCEHVLLIREPFTRPCKYRIMSTVVLVVTTLVGNALSRTVNQRHPLGMRNPPNTVKPCQKSTAWT